MVGLAVVTAVPRFGHTVTSEKRYPPHRGQKGELSSRAGWNPGSSASSSGVYWRPHMPHFIASMPIPAPHVRQIRAGASSSATKSSIWADNPESTEASNSTPQNGHDFAAVPTNDPHSGHRKSSPDASLSDPSERSPRSVSRSADVTPRTEVSSLRDAARSCSSEGNRSATRRAFASPDPRSPIRHSTQL